MHVRLAQRSSGGTQTQKAQRVTLSEPNLPSTVRTSGRESGARYPSICCLVYAVSGRTHPAHDSSPGACFVLVRESRRRTEPTRPSKLPLKNTNGSEIPSPSQIFCHTDRELSGTKIKAPGVGVAQPYIQRVNDCQ